MSTTKLQKQITNKTNKQTPNATAMYVLRDALLRVRELSGLIDVYTAMQKHGPPAPLLCNCKTKSAAFPNRECGASTNHMNNKHSSRQAQLVYHSSSSG
jgi:hypothetical protein